MLSTEQKAIVAMAEGQLALDPKHQMPKLAPMSVMVRVEAVALNPCNWRMVDYSPPTGVAAGNDYAGTIISVGPQVLNAAMDGTGDCLDLQIGDRVCGALYGLDPSLGPEEWAGSFAEYIAVPAKITMRVPSDMDMLSASCLGTTMGTAGMLIRSLGIPLLREEKDLRRASSHGEPEKQYVLVYAGSTSTGTAAIQLVKLAGMTPITTASPDNFALVKSYGAEKVFDYHDKTCGSKIREYTNGKLKLAIDCITDISSMKTCYTAIGESGGKYAGVDPPNARVVRMRKDIEADWVLGFTAFGKRVDLGGPFSREADMDAHQHMIKWFREAERLLADGMLKPHPAREMPGGLEGVIEGVDLLRKKRVRGEKLAYRVV